MILKNDLLINAFSSLQQYLNEKKFVKKFLNP